MQHAAYPIGLESSAVVGGSAAEEELTLTLVTDPRGRDAGGVEVAAAVHVALHAAQHLRGRVRRPAQRTLALEARAAAAPALATLVVAAAGGEAMLSGHVVA